MTSVTPLRKSPGSHEWKLPPCIEFYFWTYITLYKVTTENAGHMITFTSNVCQSRVRPDSPPTERESVRRHLSRHTVLHCVIRFYVRHLIRIHGSRGQQRHPSWITFTADISVGRVRHHPPWEPSFINEAKRQIVSCCCCSINIIPIDSYRSDADVEWSPPYLS